MQETFTSEYTPALSEFFKQAPAAIAILHGPEHIYTFVNPHYLKMTGSAEVDLLGKSLRELWPEGEGQGIYELLNGVFTTGEPYVAHKFPATISEEGMPHTRYYDFAAYPVKNDGVVTDIMIHANDVTEYIEAKIKTEESEEQLRLALEGTGVGTYDYYPQTGKLLWSDRTKELFGLQPDAEINYNIFLQGLHPDDKIRADVAVQHSLQQNNGGVYENEYRTVGIKDGKLRWVRSKGKVSFAADGRAYRLTGIVQEITEQKNTLASLQLQSLVLERMDEGVSISDENGVIVFANPAEEKMFGYEPGGLIGKHVTTQNAYSPEENERIVSGVIAELKEKGMWTGEWHNRKKDGTTFFTHSFITSVEVDGQMMFVCVQRNITDEKEVAQKLAYRKALLEAQNEAVPDAVLTVDTKGVILSYNKHFGKLWGIPQHIIDAKDDTAALEFAMTQVADPQAFIDRVNYCYEHPDLKAVDEIDFKDGRIIERSGNAVVGEDGTNFGWVWHFRDVTEQQKAEQSIRESENRFRTLAETLPQMIWMRSTDGVIEYASQNWERYSGIKNISEAWEYMMHPQDKPFIMGEWEKSLDTKTAFRYEVRLKNKAGEYRWHQAAGEPVKNNEGNILKWIGALSDIHEQKTFSEKLEKLVAERTLELGRSNEDLQNFAHVASHDLKEPIRKIMTFGNRLKSEFGDSVPDKAKIYLEKMENAALRSYSMIDGVLQYSSLMAGKIIKSPVNLNAVIANIETDLEVLITQKKARINIDELPTINGLDVLLYQMFYNLINNSLKFSKDDVPPFITLSAGIADDDEVNIAGLENNKTFTKLVLTDNGIGFSNEYAGKIFGTFARLHPKDVYEGTGLGLALCKKIAERHGGAIRAEGEEGEGAKFIILLPAE